MSRRRSSALVALLPFVRQVLNHRNPWFKAAGIAGALVLFMAAPEILRHADTAPSPTRAPSSAPRPGWETLPNATWVPHRSHDGDSFHVRAGDRTFELRLYFVDCPESYLSQEHASQRERVADQARALGLSLEDTVARGKTAKARVAEVLRRGPFTIHTRWERVYDGDRFYGFVELSDPERPGETTDLAEWLVRQGLARIHTKGEAHPDGRSVADYTRFLRTVEAGARRHSEGAR